MIFKAYDIRGTVPDQLDAEIAYAIGRATARFLAPAALVVGRDGTILVANPHAERLFGYPRGKLHGLAIEVLIPEQHRGSHVQLRHGFFAEPIARPMGSGRELHALTMDGREIPVEIAIGPTLV